MKLQTTANQEGFQITVGDATLTVNPMSSSALGRLRQKHTTIKRGVEKVDGAALTAEMFDRVVLDWNGIQDENGNPLACTSETKRAVYEHNGDFVGDVLKKMDDVDSERRMGLEGNLLPGLSGTSPKGK
ncbi:MAG: hypothetical protein WCZ86_05845 [Desulfurivibrionaceae bacterium]|jgi:hypothetical protein